jgi:hypothetical protein
VANVRIEPSYASSVVTWEAPGADRSFVRAGAVWFPGVRSGRRYTARVEGLLPATTYRFTVVAKAGTDSASTVAAVSTDPMPQSVRATTRGRSIELDGQPFFPVMAWGQCPDTFDELLAARVNVFLGNCPFASGDALLTALAGRAYAVLPVAEIGSSGRGLIGWNYPDEPEGYGIPAATLRDLPPASSTGRLRFLTVTYHFFSGADPIAPGRGKEIYPAYFAKADVVGFDLYPLQKFCESPWIGFEDVFDSTDELVRLQVRDRPTYQWIETGVLEGECLGDAAVSPGSVRAETWMAIAGGATGIGFFTHTWTRSGWRRYDVDRAVEVEVERTARQIDELAAALVQPPEAAWGIADAPLRVGVRRLNGATYVIAVNPSPARVRADLLVPALGSRGVEVFEENRRLASVHGLIGDSFQPFAVHVYVSAPAFGPVEPPARHNAADEVLQS